MAYRAHRLINEQGRFRCVVCRWRWRVAPADSCPGITRYAWRTIPPHLATPAQLQRAGLALPPAAQPVGCVVNQLDGALVSLYDLRQLPGAPASLQPAAAPSRVPPVRLRVQQPRRLAQPADPQAIRDWAAALVARPDGWAVLDTETTGTHRSAEAVDLAVIAPDGTPLFESLIRPLGRVQPGAARVHRISSAQLRQAPSFDELYPLLREALRDRIVLAYNADFDARILNFSCAQAGLPAIEAEWGCVMEAYQAYAPGQRYNLRAACARFGLVPGTHRAAPDALAALNVLRAIAGQPAVTQPAADAAA